MSLQDRIVSAMKKICGSSTREGLSAWRKQQEPNLSLGQSWEWVAVHVVQSFTEDGKTWTSATPGTDCRLEFGKIAKKKSNQKTNKKHNKKRPKSGQEGFVSMSEKRAKLQASGTLFPLHLHSYPVQRELLVQQNRPIPLHLQIGPQRRQNLQIKCTEKCAQAAAAAKEAMGNIAGLRSEFKCKEKSLCVVEKQVFVEFSGRVEVVLALGEKELCGFTNTRTCDFRYPTEIRKLFGEVAEFKRTSFVSAQINQ